MAFLAVFVALKIAHRAGGYLYAGWAWFPTKCDLRRPAHHLVQLKNPLNGIFEATYLFTPDFEFGMTQAFSGQTDGTSRTAMG